jgi:hypothetical protein
MRWPNKEERENWEIGQFIAHYQKATGSTGFSIHTNREKPDYVLISDATQEKIGVELTSVYLSDTSVPDNHMPLSMKKKPNKEIPYNPDDVELYQERVLKAIESKDDKALKGYSRDHPLVLSIYINEYIAIHIEHEDWTAFFERSGFHVKNTIFKAILLWPLPGDSQYLMRETDTP